MAHFFEHIVCDLPLLGMEHVVDENIVGKHKRGIECLVIDLVKESVGELPIELI